MKRSSYAREVINKSTVEIAKVEKDLDVAVGLRTGPFGDGLDALRIYVEAIFVDYES